MRRFLSSILYLGIGLPVALSGLLLFSVRPWALDRDFYRGIVDDPRLYTILRSPELAADIDERLAIGTATFDGPALAAAVQASLPEAELRRTGMAFVDGSLGAIEDGAATAQVDLRPLKAAFLKVAPTLGKAYAAALPTTAMALPAGDLTARPENLPAARAGTEMGSAIAGAVGTLPDTVPVELPRISTPGLPGAFSEARLGSLAFGTSLLAAALIAAFSLLGGGGTWAVLARAGKMVGLPSVMILVLGVILALPGASVVERMLPPELRLALGSGMTPEIRAWIGSILGTISKGFFVSGLVGVSAAGILSSLKRIGKPEES